MSEPGELPSPDLRNCDKQVLAIAKYLRHNEIIKQRPALLYGRRTDLFKVKRAVRALLDPAYEKARAKNALLPPIADREQALHTLARLPSQKFAFNVIKLETEDAIAKGMKPQSGVPVVIVSPQQKVGDNEYFVWSYSPIPLSTYFYGAALVAGGVAIALYQLWPMWARKGSYYVSVGAMGLVGALIAISVVRIVLFLLTVVSLKKGFWLFPNLYADVGFFQSFRPVWAWSGDKTLPQKPKVKKRKSKVTPQSRNPTGAAPAAGGNPLLMREGVGPVPNQPGQFQMHPMLQQLVQASIKNAEGRLISILQSEGPKSKEEVDALKQKLVQEEFGKAQEAFKNSDFMKKVQEVAEATKNNQQ